MKNFKKAEKGFAQLVILGVMALSIVSISMATKMVQKNQENRSKAAEESTMSCDVLRSTNKKYFDICADFDNVCFNKYTGEYQGCGNINGSNGGDCTDPQHNTNASYNILCSVKSGVSLTCDTLHNEKQKYFATCANNNSSGICFDSQTGEYKGCLNSDSCNSSNRVFCPVTSGDLTSWIDVAGKCGSANGKTFESTPTTDLCESGNFSRIWFSVSDHRYYWRCGDVEKFGNEAANCSAIVNGIVGASKIILDQEKVSLGVGQSIKIKATLEPSNSSDKITWSSNMPDFFSVDSNGLITMIKGSASGMVTAMTSSGQGAVVSVDTSVYTSKTDGICGTANGGVFTSIPENNLCTEAVNIQGKLNENKYIWTCFGANGGVSSTCEATISSSLETVSKPKLFFEVTKGTYPVGENVEVNVSVDSASTRINGVDIVGNYDASKLELISIKQSQSFVFNGIGECVFPKSDLGKFIASCFINDSVNDKSAFGKLITLVFKTKAVGKAEFSFDCVNKNTYDSNIIGPNSIEDIIACEQNMQMHIVVMPNDGSITPTRVPIPTKGSKINGKCGTTKNSCVTGGFVDIADSSLYYMWKCKGVNGGTTKVCSLKKTAKIDGKCGDTKNTCITGKLDPLYGTLRSDRWRCIGLNGGKTINCLTWK